MRSTPTRIPLSETNRLLGQRSANYSGNLPGEIRVSLTDACDLTCPLCYRGALKGEFDEPNTMDIATFTRMAEDVFPFTQQVILGLAGEPTLHPQFDEFVVIASQYTPHLEVYTNGSFLSRPHIRQAILRSVDTLVISMDGASAKTLAKTRGGISLGTLTDDIRSLTAAANASTRIQKLDTAFHVTIRSANVHELGMIVELAAELGVRRVSGSHVGILNPRHEHETLYLDQATYNEALSDALTTAERLGIEAIFPPPFDLSTEIQDNCFTRCHSVDFEPCVFANGDVVPCCHTWARRALVMGNLHEAPFEDVWFSDRYSWLRKRLREQDYLPLCKECTSGIPILDMHASRENFVPIHPYADGDDAFPYEAVHRQWEDELIEEQRALLDHATHLQAVTNECSARQQAQIHSMSPMHENSVSLAQQDRAFVERARNVARYKNGIPFQGNYPLHLDVSLIPGCNIRCIMCELAHRSEEEQRALRKKPMAMAVLEKLAAEAFPRAESVLFGIGGEPTLHPQFATCLEMAHATGIDVRVSSNGTTLVNEDIRNALIANASWLILSIDSTEPAVFERIRSGAKWAAVKRGIDLLNEMRRANGSTLQLQINVTLMKDTIDGLPDIIKFAHANGFSKVTAEHLLSIEDTLTDQSLFHIPEHADAKFVEAIQTAQRLGIRLELPDFFNTKHEHHCSSNTITRAIRPKVPQPKQPLCNMLSYTATVYPGGTLFSCPHPDMVHQTRPQSLKDESFGDIWFGEQFQRLRDGDDARIEAICQRCSMCGRSDVDVPVSQGANAQLHDETNVTRLPTRRRLLYSIHFLNHLQNENEELKRALTVRQRLLDEMLPMKFSPWREQLRENHKRRWALARTRLIPIKDRIMNKPTYRCELTWSKKPITSLVCGSHFAAHVHIHNTGSSAWQHGCSEEQESVMIGGGFYQHNQLVKHFGGWAELPATMATGDECGIEIHTNCSGLEPGVYELRIDAVKLGLGFFADFGSTPLTETLTIREPNASQRLWERGLQSCTNLWTPTQGEQSETYAYPLFITEAKGTRVRDVEGNEYLDFIMGWGTATLGYQRKEVQDAIAEALTVAPTLPLSHPYQVEVAERLKAFLPCAERVLFGKNGSDVVEAAVRIARSHTKRDRVLCCGYHGFHDWYVGCVPGVTGVPEATSEMVSLFPYGDFEALRSYLNEFHGEISAIVMEPFSLGEPPEGYLENIRLWTQEHGIVLIFDEIISAFRIANGGAQERCGVVPDMVTVGKGIANGMPLAALGGSYALMEHAFQIGYGPTFQGEVYSLAAARAALSIFAQEPVCEHINALGAMARAGIMAIAETHSIDLTLQGVDPRLVFHFADQCDVGHVTIRTFFIQELLRNGILSCGVLLPSYAHTQDDIQRLLDTMDGAFSKLRMALNNRTLDTMIDIPMHQLYLGESKALR